VSTSQGIRVGLAYLSLVLPLTASALEVVPALPGQSAKLDIRLYRNSESILGKKFEVNADEVLYAEDQIILCVWAPVGFASVWSLTDTRVSQLWAGATSSGQDGTCIGAVGKRKLWIGYGGEDTEFALFWSSHREDQLSEDAFISSGNSAEAGRQGLKGDVAHISSVWNVADEPRGPRE